MQAVVDAKTGKVSYSIDMQYNHSNFEQYDTESKSVWRGKDIVSAERTGSLQGPTNNVVVAPTMQWNINDRNKLEAIYRMEHSYNDSRQIQQFTEDILGEKKVADTRLSDEIKRTSHNPSLFYTYKTGEHSLRISADYYRMNTKICRKQRKCIMMDRLIPTYRILTINMRFWWSRGLFRIIEGLGNQCRRKGISHK